MAVQSIEEAQEWMVEIHSNYEIAADASASHKRENEFHKSFLNTLWERSASFPFCNCSHHGDEYFGMRRLVFK